MVKEPTFTGGSHGAGWPWLRAPLTQEPHGHGCGYWEDWVRAAESSSLAEVGLHSSMPQVQPAVRLSTYSQVRASTRATHIYTHCRPQRSTQTDMLRAHTDTNSPRWPHSVANQDGGPLVRILYIYICIYIQMWKVDPSSSWARTLDPGVRSCLHLDVWTPSAVAPLQPLVQTTRHTHAPIKDATTWCASPHPPTSWLPGHFTHSPATLAWSLPIITHSLICWFLQVLHHRHAAPSRPSSHCSYWLLDFQLHTCTQNRDPHPGKELETEFSEDTTGCTDQAQGMARQPYRPSFVYTGPAPFIPLSLHHAIYCYSCSSPNDLEPSLSPPLVLPLSIPL